jgi:hypothetical protein
MRTARLRRRLMQVLNANLGFGFFEAINRTFRLYSIRLESCRLVLQAL